MMLTCSHHFNLMQAEVCCQYEGHLTSHIFKISIYLLTKNTGIMESRMGSWVDKARTELTCEVDQLGRLKILYIDHQIFTQCLSNRIPQVVVDSALSYSEFDWRKLAIGSDVSVDLWYHAILDRLCKSLDNRENCLHWAYTGLCKCIGLRKDPNKFCWIEGSQEQGGPHNS